MSDKNLCEIKRAFVLALGEQYENYITKKSKVLLKYNLNDFRDMVEDLGLNDELTADEMTEIVFSSSFLLEVAGYIDIENEFTSSEPNKDKVKDIVQQWALVANIIRCHEEHEDGRYEYPEDFVLSSPGTQSR